MSKKGSTLVAYFSCSGQTRRLAGTIAAVTGGTLFEIRPAEAYTSADLNWNDPHSRSSREMNDPACRPAIAQMPADLAAYDTVFVGFPIWWYTAPRIIDAFLEQGDFAGRTVIPFATSGSSGMGGTDADLQALRVPGAVWRPGRRFAASADRRTVQSWVEELER